MQFFISLLLTIFLCAPAIAAFHQIRGSSGASGVYGRGSRRTGMQARDIGISRVGLRDRIKTVSIGKAQLAPRFGGVFRRNGLPETTLDSFVLQAKGDADAIYGDEGTVGLPPFGEPGFTREHRIERGITGERSIGLTTGHGSVLPAAWGGDEFVKGSEFSLSGTGDL